MRDEPLMREDGKCARHGCQRELPAIAVTHADPFCSSDCARRYHGVRFKPDIGTFGKGKRRAA